jgi:hypothetical protein
MFFFSGFGPIFPYLIYLSLIWICILFGFGHKFRIVIHFQPVKSHISYVNEKFHSSEKTTINPFNLKEPVKRISKKVILFSSKNCRLFPIELAKQRLVQTNQSVARLLFIIQYSRRGPPRG